MQISLLETKYHDFNEEDLKDHDTIVGVIREDNKFLIQDHIKHDMLTFPVGKVKPTQTVTTALKTELWEELGIKVIKYHELFVYIKNYVYNGKRVKVKVHVFDILNYSGKPLNKEPEKHKWVKFMTMDEIQKSGRTLSDCLLEYISRYESKVPSHFVRRIK